MKEYIRAPSPVYNPNYKKGEPMAYTPEKCSVQRVGAFNDSYHEFRLLRSRLSNSSHLFYCIHCLKIVDQGEKNGN